MRRWMAVSACLVLAALLLAGCNGPAPEKTIPVPLGLPSDDCPASDCRPRSGERLLTVTVVDDRDDPMGHAAVVLLAPGSASPLAMARTGSDGVARFVTADGRLEVAASVQGSTTERVAAPARGDHGLTVRLYDEERLLHYDRTMGPVGVGHTFTGHLDRFEVHFDGQLHQEYAGRLRTIDYTLLWENRLPDQHADLHGVLHVPGANEWQKTTDRDDTLATGTRTERAMVSEADAYYVRDAVAAEGLFVETRTARAAVGVLDIHAEHHLHVTFRGSDVRIVDAPRVAG